MGGTRIFRPNFEKLETGATAKTVVIAGGAGFIGSNLSHRLIAEGNRVICIDNMETGRHENIAGLLTHPNFAFFLHDILDPFRIKGPVDRIYNMACPGSPPKYQRDPIHTFKTSVFGGLNLLEVAEEKGARILQSSTSEVYGDPDISPQTETYRGLVNTVGPRSCYDEGKRGVETLFHEMHERRGVDTRIARIFNTYGPRMDPEDGRVVSNFVMQALMGKDLTVYGNGGQTRSFCYIDDLLNGLTALMEGDDPLGTIFAPVNLGNPGEFTILELAETVLRMTGSQSELVYRDLPIDDPHQRCPDISRAKSILDWEPKIPLKDGLIPTIAYFKGEISGRQTFAARSVA